MKLQERLKRAIVKKRGAHIVLSPKEVKTTPEIICTECKEPSGYKNEDFINTKPPRDIKCNKCKKVFMRITNSYTDTK